MKNNEKLKKYIDKIRLESIIKSILYGLVVGLVFMSLLSFILYLCKTKELLLVIILGVLVIVFSSIFIYKKVFVPSINKVANRIDELGLDERIITMVENEDKESYIYQKQREDAFEKLENVKTSEIKFRFSKMSFILLGAILVLSGFTFTLPDRSPSNSSFNSSLSGTSNSNISSSIISSTSSSSSELIDEDAIIQEMLDKLREIIERAGIDQDVKDELNEIVDRLEEEIKGLDTLQEKIDAIKETQKEIQQRIEEELLKMSLGRALQQYDLTKELGIAIYQEDLDKVNIAMNNLIILIQQSENPIEDARKIMECLNNALAVATKEDNEALIEAVQKFADNLAAIVGEDSGETMSLVINNDYVVIEALDGEDDQSSIIEILETANQEIQDALRKSEETQIPEQGEGQEDQEGEQTEQDVQDAGNEMNSAMDDAIEDLEDLLEKEQQGEDQEGNKGEEGEPGDELPPPTFDDSDLDSDNVIDGDTPYLDVFDEYYQEILDYLANNEDIPDDLREAIEEYLEMIKG